jgi:hypothetical protein
MINNVNYPKPPKQEEPKQEEPKQEEPSEYLKYRKNCEMMLSNPPCFENNHIYKKLFGTIDIPDEMSTDTYVYQKMDELFNLPINPQVRDSYIQHILGMLKNSQPAKEEERKQEEQPKQEEPDHDFYKNLYYKEFYELFHIPHGTQITDTYFRQKLDDLNNPGFKAFSDSNEAVDLYCKLMRQAFPKAFTSHSM